MNQDTHGEAAEQAENHGTAVRILKAVREFMHGMVLHEPTMVALQEKVALERLLILVMFGDMLGIPIFRPYFFLRLLPHVYPRIDSWKRSLLRERDWTDAAFD
ncbi:MAG: hypothetical protein LDL33_00340 [Desulfomonile sp.]|nr:hypothetical protein [Desulfomonile sp.]